MAGAAAFSQHRFVMARFMRAIHDFAASARKKDVDGPDKPGHDVVGMHAHIHRSFPLPEGEREIKSHSAFFFSR